MRPPIVVGTAPESAGSPWLTGPADISEPPVEELPIVKPAPPEPEPSEVSA